MAVTRTPRAAWVEHGLRALAAGGPEAVRVEALARALGVTKGGFYWHFDDRGALLEEMLDAWERALVDEVIERVESENESGAGDGRTRLTRLFVIASAAEELLQIDLAIRDWARRDPRVADRLRRADDRRMDYMRGLIADFCADEAEVEARCMVAFSLWIGNHFVAATHGRRSRQQVLELVLQRLLA